MKFQHTLALMGLAGALSLPPALAQDAAGSQTSDPVLTTTAWRQGPDLETPRAGLSAVEFEGNLYAAGGAGLVNPRDDFEVYETATGRWRPLAPLPTGLERFGMAAGDERLWIAGGYSSDSTSSATSGVWSYDPEMDVWQAEADLPGPKAAFSLVAFDGSLYAIGGEEGAPGVFVYDIEAGLWSAIEAPPEINRRGAVVVVVGDEIWLLGGATGGEATARVDVFNPLTGVWRIGPALPEPRAGHAAALHDGVIYVFGGRSPDLRRTLSDMLYLPVSQRRWQSGPQLMVPRTEAAAASNGNQIFLIGGGAGSGFFAPFTAVSSVDIYTPSGE